MEIHHRQADESRPLSLWWLGYPLLGVFAGFVAGLFGVGGGLTIVPLLFMLFTAQQFPVEHSMHLALGTSMATIVFTSVSSMRAHHGHGAVRWDIVKSFAPGLVAGTLAGSFLVAWVPTRPLAIMFTAIVYYASLQIMLDFKPKPHRQLPGTPGMAGAGTLIGIFSSLVAAGGGFLSIPFMLFCNVSIRHAVGTSAALGFPIAVAGTVGLHRQRPEGLRPAGVFAGLCVPAGAGGRGRDQFPDGAGGRRTRPPAAGETAKARLRRIPRPARDQDAARPADDEAAGIRAAEQSAVGLGR
jgi:uncharacterized membrane protein YfcA